MPHWVLLPLRNHRRRGMRQDDFRRVQAGWADAVAAVPDQARGAAVWEHPVQVVVAQWVPARQARVQWAGRG